jgi:hypothetical protein
MMSLPISKPNSSSLLTGLIANVCIIIFGRLKMKKASKILLLMVVGVSLISEGKVFSQITEKEIIERLTRLEEGQKSILREMNKRFEDINKRFDNLVSVFIGIVGAFAGIVAITIGFAIWDRRTALAPAIKNRSGA